MAEGAAAVNLAGGQRGALHQPASGRKLVSVKRLLPLLALVACAGPPPVATLSGTPPTPLYAVAGDGPAAAEVQRQLIARGLYAADAATILRTGYALAPRRLGACLATDAQGACTAWHEAPARGWDPIAPPLRHHLALAWDDGHIDVTQAGDGSDRAAPLPALVSAALAKLPGAAK